MEREVLIVGFPGAALLDVAGPADVFGAAAKARGGYRVRIAAVGGDFDASGVRLAAEDLRDVTGPVDTLVVVGGHGFEEAARDVELAEHLRRLASGSRRVASVCTGTFPLAAAGLLAGARVTTHWAYCARLAAEHPSLEVVPDAIYVCDGRVATSAGVTAGIDLALALLEQDHDAALARLVARWLVVFMQRPGGQSQFSVRARVPPVREPGLRALLDAIAEDPAAPWTVDLMARRAAMSPRHFARVFPRRVGVPPARYVERARVEAAAGALESGDEGLDVVARRSGFGSAETMRRAFLRVLGVTPGGYRDRFRTTGVA
ncbi:GlxA family transcriptional regulator [Saccharothrix obliqua]|uniref:GlxA family transcriptional regulator n=1 Tax=Saccharothrix obliqua TaxID=2861747 RepID=UPI001C5EF0D6|nr:DJ-1/PfpI family protein [Saccharothrix obliqua]MBW4717708.1 DJ-1/PfpI family protein [Saccharothrix obliqua]